jgi:arsenate reductase
MMIYGLGTCAVCQRALKELEAAGKEVSFRDVRAEPLTEAELTDLITEFGDRLVDRKSNDYRALNTWLKNSEAEAQISAQPKGIRLCRMLYFKADAAQIEFGAGLVLDGSD